MKKQTIKLTESKLRALIEETVRQTLKEGIFKLTDDEITGEDERRFFPSSADYNDQEEYLDMTDRDGMDYDETPWEKEHDMEWDEVYHGNPNVRNGGGQDAMDALGARGKERERIAKTMHNKRFF